MSGIKDMISGNKGHSQITIPSNCGFLYPSSFINGIDQPIASFSSSERSEHERSESRSQLDGIPSKWAKEEMNLWINGHRSLHSTIPSINCGTSSDRSEHERSEF
eukprot:70905_1